MQFVRKHEILDGLVLFCYRVRVSQLFARYQEDALRSLTIHLLQLLHDFARPHVFISLFVPDDVAAFLLALHIEDVRVQNCGHRRNDVVRNADDRKFLQIVSF